MAELDNTIPLNTLMSRQKPIYQGQPMTELATYGIQQDEAQQKRTESADAKYREEMTRKVFGEALANGVDLEQAAKAVAKYDPELSYKLLTQYRMEKNSITTAENQAKKEADKATAESDILSTANIQKAASTYQWLLQQLSSATNESDKAVLKARLKLMDDTYKGSPLAVSLMGIGEGTGDIDGTSVAGYQTKISEAKDKQSLEVIKADYTKDSNIGSDDRKSLDITLGVKLDSFPKASKIEKRPENTSADAKNIINSGLGTLASMSLVSSLDPSNASDRQIIWKVNQRAFTPEAVNEGDLTLGRSWLEKVASKITGVPPTISEDEAKRAMKSLHDQYIKASNTVKGMTSDKYLGSVSLVTNDNVNKSLSQYGWNYAGDYGSVKADSGKKAGNVKDLFAK